MVHSSSSGTVYQVLLVLSTGDSLVCAAFQDRTLLIVQVTICRVWQGCTRKLPALSHACVKHAAMLSVVL